MLLTLDIHRTRWSFLCKVKALGAAMDVLRLS